MTERIRAALTWTGSRFERGVVVEIGDDGMIRRVGAAEDARDLTNRALLPGFISAHSHAFQRALRGRGESFPSGQGSFWSWREAMYKLVTELDAQRFYDETFATYQEMLAAGITTVGEFHYLPEFDAAVLAAARDAGIRLVLLNSYYRTGGIAKPLEGPQVRFGTASVPEYWEAMHRLASQLDSRTQVLGASAHSIRAASPEEIASLYEEATLQGMVFHMHLEEQPREVEDSITAYEKTPMRLMLDLADIGANFTGIHCTQSLAEDLREYLERGGNICVTPLTEANLGDGFPDAEMLRADNVQISIGSDSNTRISMLEEMRWLEYIQRIATGSRGAYLDGHGRVAPRLLRAATEAGAHSLGIQAGSITAGAFADFVTIDLAAPELAGWTDETLLDALIFGAGDRVVAEVCVHGVWR
jgi:formimidoylglutamate deiminase